jgi:hypothetical protein
MKVTANSGDPHGYLLFRGSMAQCRMRKLLLFVIATALVAGGLYLIGAEIFLARGIYLRVVFVASVLLLFGGYLLWADFVAPFFHFKTWEDR